MVVFEMVHDLQFFGSYPSSIHFLRPPAGFWLLQFIFILLPLKFLLFAIRFIVFIKRKHRVVLFIFTVHQRRYVGAATHFGRLQRKYYVITAHFMTSLK